MNFNIVRFGEGHRTADFWVAMGPFFANKEIRKDLPNLTDNDRVVWFLVMSKPSYPNIEETVLAFASVEVDAKGVGHLRNLYVVPSYRNEGYASALMDARIAYLRGIGVTTAQTTRRVSKEIQFAEHHGFTVVKVEGGYQILRATLEPMPAQPVRTAEEQAAFDAGHQAAEDRLKTLKKRPQKLRPAQKNYKKWADKPGHWLLFCEGWTARLKAEMSSITTWNAA